MTAPSKTVTDHLLEAQAALDRNDPAVPLKQEDLQTALDCIERALDTINLARCEAQTALDRF